MWLLYHGVLLILVHLFWVLMDYVCPPMTFIDFGCCLLGLWLISFASPLFFLMLVANALVRFTEFVRFSVLLIVG